MYPHLAATVRGPCEKDSVGAVLLLLLLPVCVAVVVMLEVVAVALVGPGRDFVVPPPPPPPLIAIGGLASIRSTTIIFRMGPNEAKCTPGVAPLY